MFDTKEKNQSFVIGLVLTLLTFGLVLVAYYMFTRDKKMRSQDVLNKVKGEFKKSGPIEGSWIEMTSVNYDVAGEERPVYHGGITRKEDSTFKQYEFIADALNGQLLSTYPLNVL